MHTLLFPVTPKSNARSKKNSSYRLVIVSQEIFPLVINGDFRVSVNPVTADNVKDDKFPMHESQIEEFSMHTLVFVRTPKSK